MRNLMLACGAASLALATTSWAPSDSACSLAYGKQDKNIHDVVFQYRKSITRIAGVIDVSVAGLNGDNRILIRVDSKDAREAVEQLCGKKLEGFPVQILVTDRPRTVADEEPDAPAEPAPKPPARPTIAAPRAQESTKAEERIDLKDPFEECDILREALRLKPRKEGPTGRCAWTRRIVWTTPGTNKRPNPPPPLVVIGSPEGSGWHRGEGVAGTTWSAVYAKHRKDCPIYVRDLIDRIFNGLGAHR